MNSELISKLEKWYLSRCDGEWEHGYGIKIDTLDNPGWVVKIDLTENDLAVIRDVKLKVERSTSDWLVLKIENRSFVGVGGAQNLNEIVEIFFMILEGKELSESDLRT